MARVEGSDSSGLTPSELLQMSESSSRHWCGDWDVNKQMEDYYTIPGAYELPRQEGAVN